jgi:hypothetical protein
MNVRHAHTRHLINIHNLKRLITTTVFQNKPSQSDYRLGRTSNRIFNLQRFLSLMVVAFSAVMSTSNQAQANDIGLSLSIGQPNFSGRLDIGGYPQPRVIYRQPIVIEQVPMD